VRVKGKLEPVRIFELICEGKPTEDWAECLKNFAVGYQLYHQKNFVDATTAFQEALRARPTDPVAELYLERCAGYIEEPPPENWDGVHVMKTK
jgi:adenylate cyclase